MSNALSGSKANAMCFIVPSASFFWNLTEFASRRAQAASMLSTERALVKNSDLGLRRMYGRKQTYIWPKRAAQETLALSVKVRGVRRLLISSRF